MTSRTEATVKARGRGNISNRTLFARKPCTSNAFNVREWSGNSQVKRCGGGTISEDIRKQKKITPITSLKSFIERKCSENLKDYMLPFALQSHVDLTF